MFVIDVIQLVALKRALLLEAVYLWSRLRFRYYQRYHVTLEANHRGLLTDPGLFLEVCSHNRPEEYALHNVNSSLSSLYPVTEI